MTRNNLFDGRGEKDDLKGTQLPAPLHPKKRGKRNKNNREAEEKQTSYVSSKTEH